MTSSLITSLNLNTVLPSFLEVWVSHLLDESLFNLLKYGFAALAERSARVAALTPYDEEILTSAIAAIQYKLIFGADVPLAEALMGLMRASIVEKPSSHYQTFRRAGRLFLPPRWFGPPPSVCPEERALWPAVPTTDGLRQSSSNVSGGADALLSGRGLDGLGDDANALEAMEVDNSVYGHLRFKPLSKTQKVVSLLVVTLLPYLKRRLAAWHDNAMENTTDAVAARASYARRHPTLALLNAIAAKYVYPSAYVVYHSLDFLFKLFYVLEMTPYTTPIHRLFRIGVRRMDKSAMNNSKARRAISMVSLIFLAMYSSTALIQFTTQLLNRSGSSSAPTDSVATLPIPPAPQCSVHTHLPDDTPLPQPGECPVCKKEIVNKCVVTASGILGCYVCLQEYIQQHQRCPVTKQPATEHQIRRIITD